jgi:acetylornithine deacetylase/succinyl-diaminopimelate desuccinylase-like protein
MSTARSEIEREIVGILGELIAIPSQFPPGDTRAICAFAERRLRDAGYATETVVAEAPIANLVARRGRGRPCLVFNAHVDTVGIEARDAWHTDPFRAEISDDRLRGLGAANCKGSAAVQLWLALEIARRNGPGNGELVFTFVGDEERLGPAGMAHLREAGIVRPDILILGAPTSNALVVAERGVMWARIETFGRAAHAGSPELGDNALMRMLRLLGRLEAELSARLARRTRGAQRSTVNPGLLRAGHNTNVVPSHAVAEIDRRLLPEESVAGAFAEIEAILAAAGEPAGSWRVELLRGTEGFEGDRRGACVQAFETAIREVAGRPAAFANAIGVSDGRYFAEDGVEIVNFGPGPGEAGHAANEYVPLPELVDAALVQLAVAERLLGTGA